MNNLIRIDTSDTYNILVQLEHNGKIFSDKVSSTVAKSQAVLPVIEALLDSRGISVHEIDRIYVKTGPGSFTGLRVGIAIANTIGYLLNLPVNDLPIGLETKPQYE